MQMCDKFLIIKGVAVIEFETVIKTRRSVRKFTNQYVPNELLLKAVELATYASNGGNYQPWKFIIVRNKQIIIRMADEVQKKVDLIASWPEASKYGETMERYCKNTTFFRYAPVVIAVCGKTYQSVADKVLNERKNDQAAAEMIAYRKIGNSRTQSVAAATENLVLALHYLGLGACWMNGPLLAKKEIEAMIFTGDEYELLALVPIGYQAEHPELKSRKPVTEVVKIID